MDVSSYELPGVYVKEVEGLTLSSSAGGNAVMALVGTSLGYRIGSKQSVLPIVTDAGVSSASDITAIDKISGSSLTISSTSGATESSDLLASIASGIATVSRREKLDASSSSSKTGISLVVGSAATLTNKHIVWLTTSLKVTVSGSEKTLREFHPADTASGYDYMVDYSTNEISWNFNSDGKLAYQASLSPAVEISAGSACTASLYETDLQPIFFSGTAVTNLDKGYAIIDTASSSPKVPKLYKANASALEEQTAYVYGTDYTLPNDTKGIAKTVSSAIPDYDSQTASSYPLYVQYYHSNIASTNIVNVQYKFVPSDFGTPKYCTSFSQVKNLYGGGWSSDGTVNSEVTRAAYIAFQNGASGMWISPVQSSSSPTDTDWQNALEELDIVTGIKIIVPVTGDTAKHTLAIAYANSRTANEDECRVIIGYDGSSTVVPSSTLINRASGYNAERICVVSPSRIVMTNPVTSINENVGGYLIAAAVAGYSSSVPQFTPLTNKSINGFYANAESRTKAEIKNEIANGVMFVGTDTIKIVHGVTTSTASQTKREYNVSITKDYIFTRLRNAYSAVIGTVLTSRTLASVESITGSLLSTLQDAGYINGYKSVSVAQDTTEQTLVNVSFSYMPVFGVNYIEVTFTIDTTSAV